MRPTLLDPFFVPITALKGVGTKVGALLTKLLDIPASEGVARIIDLIQLMPHSVIDRSKRPGIAFAQEGEIVTLELIIESHAKPPKLNKKLPYRVYAHDNTGEICLTFFHAKQLWLETQLPIGQKVLVSGRIEWFNGRATMVHPDYMSQSTSFADFPLIEPIYPLTNGLINKVVARAINQAMTNIPSLPEWIDPTVANQHHWLSYKQSLHNIHAPSSVADIAPEGINRTRLAYDELLAGQLALAMVRAQTRNLNGRSLPANHRFTQALKHILPFKLTKGQLQAIDEISRDLAAPERMLRLLQGDVGSGKTVVALMAMAQAAESGGQSALMAPTEVLARQHYQTISTLAEQIGLKTALLTGREKGNARQNVLDGIAAGTTSIIIGTHALIQDNVDYHDLALAIIDEQHRFGVHQRLQLTSKGQTPDMLVMTATPIPRSLVLTAFGDMDVSKLTEKPIGRKKITTAILPLTRIDELIERVASAIQQGEKVYWISPLVEESQALNLTSALERFESLHQRFRPNIGLVHGKMANKEKDAAMAAFKEGSTRLLVATTVVEVGVDISDASIIIIEHAERYGLAQLHQLRGRVGRSDKQSFCILLYKGPLSKMAHARLSIMRETEDGFRIAEEDLRLRGEGDLLGTKQSGLPAFKFADLNIHADLLSIARQDARLILEKDGALTSLRGQALRNLLYLFRRNDAVKLLRSG